MSNGGETGEGPRDIRENLPSAVIYVGDELNLETEKISPEKLYKLNKGERLLYLVDTKNAGEAGDAIGELWLRHHNEGAVGFRVVPAKDSGTGNDILGKVAVIIEDLPNLDLDLDS